MGDPETLVVYIEELETFIASKGLSLIGDFSVNPLKDPQDVACQYMAAWLGFDSGQIVNSTITL